MPGNVRRRRVFLVALSAAIILLFVVLPFWLLYRRHFTPPSPDAFGPAAPAEPSKSTPERTPRPGRYRPVDDEDKPLQFK